ncbi:MAG: DUF1465 family protein, partial [Alphaproteobacteria bacterium]|nr:DUF1465 family protein [Alphaproteobacteria bacterium]
MTAGNSIALTRKLIDSLYVEAMVLADEARTYFEFDCIEERKALAPTPRVLFSCEAIKVSTRLMHIINWLLEARARIDAEMPPPLREVEGRGRSILVLPAPAREIIIASENLYTRVRRLDIQLHDEPSPSP